MSIRNALHRAATVAAVSAVAVVSLAGTASAIVAPYAQAAGSIRADGTVIQSKGVIEVTKPNTGNYCIKLDIPTPVNQLVATATAMATAPSDAAIRVAPWSTGTCNNDPNTLTVYTGTGSETYKDVPFNFTVS